MLKAFRLGVFASVVLCAMLLQGGASQTALEAQDRRARPAAVLTPGELEAFYAWLRADHAAAFEHSSGALKAGQATTYEEFRLLLQLMANAADELGWHQKALDRLNEIKAPNLPGAAAALAFDKSKRLDRLGRLAESEACHAEIGVLKRWRVCGPFPNDRGQGFDSIQAPEREFNLAAEYAGKDGRMVNFRDLPVSPRAGVIDLGAMMRPNKEATAFLVTAIYCENPVETTVWVSSDGPLKIWAVSPGSSALGAGLELTDAERTLGFDQDYCVAKLAKGWNLLVLKSGVGEHLWRASLRVEGKGWREAADEREFKLALAMPGDAPSLRPHLPAAPAASLRAHFLAGAGELLLPTRDRLSTFSRQRLTSLLDEFEKLPVVVSSPASYNAERAVLKYLLAEAGRSGTQVAAGREENRRRALLAEVLELEPRAARAAYGLVIYYASTFVNPTLADKNAKLALELAPDWIEIRIYAAQVASLKGLVLEVQREITSLVKKFPNHSLVLHFAGYFRGQAEDYAGAHALYERALKADYTDSYSRDRLFDRAVEQGDARTAVRLAEEIRGLDPFDLVTRRKMAQMHMTAGTPGLALVEINRALGVAPLDDEFLALKCETHLRLASTLSGQAAERQRAQALEACRAALKANPNRQDLEKYLEFLSDERPRFEALLQENIEARIERALTRPIDGDDPCRVVYSDDITVVNEDGTTVVYGQRAYRVCNDQGREWLRTSLRIELYRGQQGRVVEGRLYRQDGTVEEGRRMPNHVEFAPLNVGDIVMYRYRTSDTEQSFFGDFFGVRQPLVGYLRIGNDYVNFPTDEMRLVYVLPKARKFYEYRTGGAPERVERLEGDHRVWTYTAKNLTKPQEEVFTLPLAQLVPTVQISTYENWKDFGKWYYSLIRKQLEPTDTMAVKVAQLTEGKTSEKEKVRAIYNYVVTQIRYNADWHFGVHGYKPFTAGAIFERCIGDCKDKAIVMCAMLGLAGIKAWPVLVDLKSLRGREDLTLPLPHHFNHAIVYVEYTDGTGQFLDGTTTYNGMDELPSADAGAEVVLIKPEGGVRARIPLPSAIQNRQTLNIALSLEGRGQARISANMTAVGNAAADLRATFLQEGDRKRRLEQSWSIHFPGAAATLIKTNDLSNLDVAPRLNFAMTLPNAYDEQDGVIELRAVPNPCQWTETRLGSLVSRKNDMALPAPYSQLTSITLELPKGKKLEAVPARFVYDDGFVSLRVEVTVKDRIVTIEREYAFLKSIIPRDHYGKLREGLAAFDRAEVAILRLVKE